MNTIITLNNYIVKILSTKIYDFDSLSDSLNSKNYPRQIIEVLENIDCVRRISIYDKNNNHIITSSIEIL